LQSLAVMVLLEERRQQPRGGAEQQYNAHAVEHGPVRADRLEYVTGHGWPDELHEPVAKQRYAVRRGQPLLAQHVNHYDGRDADHDAGTEPERGARATHGRVVVGEREREQRDARQDEPAQIVVPLVQPDPVGQRAATHPANEVEHGHHGQQVLRATLVVADADGVRRQQNGRVRVPDGRGRVGHEYDDEQWVGQQLQRAGHGLAAGRQLGPVAALLLCLRRGLLTGSPLALLVVLPPPPPPPMKSRFRNAGHVRPSAYSPAPRYTSNRRRNTYAITR